MQAQAPGESGKRNLTVTKKNRAYFRLQHISKYRSELYGISIVWIMLFHNRASYPGWLNWLLPYGSIGCEMFLFVSGISLYYAMQNRPSLARYGERRMLRLLIPLWVVSLWEWIYLLQAGEIRFLQLVSRMTLLDFWMTGRQQAWFLALLLVAYLLYPYLYSFMYEGRGSVALRAALLEFLTVGVILMIYHLTPAYYGMIEIALTRFPVFVLGAAFGRVVYEGRRIPGRPWLLLGLLLVAAVSFWVLNEYLPNGAMLERRLFNLVPGVTLVLLFSQLFGKTRGLVNRIFAFFGNMSVELYLLHLMGRRLLPTTGFYDQSKHLHYFAMLGAAVVLAWVLSKLDKAIAGRVSRLLD